MCTATTDWEETLFWITWFTPAWQAQHVPSTCGATVTVTSLAAFAYGGKVEGPKSDQAFPGGNSLLECVFYARVRRSMCQVRVGRQKVISLVALAGGGKVERSKVTRPVWEETHFWIMWYSPVWQAQHVPSTYWATV